MNARTITRAAGMAACTAAMLAAVVLTGKGSPAMASAEHAHRLPHVTALRYDRDGAQLTCTRRERGWYGLVFGDRRPFAVKCVADGPVFVWDAIR